MAILIFILAHWYLSVFCQSFFLHRYTAHKMFTLTRGWERFFYLLTFIVQGASFLNPRSYAILHRKHHAFSDTEKDPHSPLYFDSPWKMMVQTFHFYRSIFSRQLGLEKDLEQGYPEWPGFDEWADGRPVRLAFISVYIGIYVLLKAEWWMYAFIPVHALMGPIHGAIVNWCGHKYGYKNFDNGDNSKNSLGFEIVCVGELMQNNHHRYPKRPNFAVKPFEWDPTYGVIKLLAGLKVIQMAESRETAAIP